jgi:hypothetical protein
MTTILWIWTELRSIQSLYIARLDVWEEKELEEDEENVDGD